MVVSPCKPTRGVKSGARPTWFLFAEGGVLTVIKLPKPAQPDSWLVSIFICTLSGFVTLHRTSTASPYAPERPARNYMCCCRSCCKLLSA